MERDHKIRINISVEVDDEVIYEDWSYDMEDFEGSCLRKAEHAIKDKLAELEAEEDSDGGE